MKPGGIYYFQTDHSEEGPLSLAELMKLLATGAVTPKTPVKGPGMEYFKPFDETELKAELPMLPVMMKKQRNNTLNQWMWFAVPVVLWLLWWPLTRGLNYLNVQTTYWWLFVLFAQAPLLVTDELLPFLRKKTAAPGVTMPLLLPGFNLLYGLRLMLSTPGFNKTPVLLYWLVMAGGQFAALLAPATLFWDIVAVAWFAVILALAAAVYYAPWRSALRQIDRTMDEFNLQTPEEIPSLSGFLDQAGYSGIDTPGWRQMKSRERKRNGDFFLPWFGFFLLSLAVWIGAFWLTGFMLLENRYAALKEKGIAYEWPGDEVNEQSRALEELNNSLPRINLDFFYDDNDFLLKPDAAFDARVTEALTANAEYLEKFAKVLDIPGKLPRQKDPSLTQANLNRAILIMPFLGHNTVKNGSPEDVNRTAALWRAAIRFNPNNIKYYVDFVAACISAGKADEAFLREQLDCLKKIDERIIETRQENHERILIIYSDRITGYPAFDELLQTDRKFSDYAFWLKPWQRANFWHYYTQDSIFELKEFYQSESALLAAIEKQSERHGVCDDFLSSITFSLISHYSYYQAAARCGYTIIELELYRREHGSLLENPELPVDPFDGKPLRYRHGEIEVSYGKFVNSPVGEHTFEFTGNEKAGGYRVYSVGLAKIDNGGVYDPEQQAIAVTVLYSH